VKVNSDSKNTLFWLECLQNADTRYTNNQALADVLGVSRAAISQQKRGIYAMSVKAAVTTAYALEIHPMLVIASTQFDSAPNEADRIFWLTTYLKWADKAPAHVKPPITEHLPEPA
jgi:DNA-binding XRE family transcriptional regulator